MMFFYVTPAGQPPKVVELAFDPFWDYSCRFEHVSPSYESEEALRWGEGLNDCRTCPEKIRTHFTVRDELMRLGLCLRCYLLRKEALRAH